MLPSLNFTSYGPNSDQLCEYAKCFMKNFGLGRSEAYPQFEIAGRILRGKTPNDFNTLSDKPDRKIVFFLDSASLNELIGLTGIEILMQIGYDPDYITHLKEDGTVFKLSVFPRELFKLGNWDNLLDLASEFYPNWTSQIAACRGYIKQLSYDQAIQSGGVLRDVRVFLETTLNVLPGFAGDGKTRLAGRQDLPFFDEFIGPNKNLEDFGSYVLIDFPV